MKILVIEDEPASLKLAALVLSTEGHEVTETKTAEQAIKALSEKHPEVILLDLGLPGMDGFALARRLKEDAATKHIPIFAVTSYPDRFPREQAFESGCDGYLVKPINTRTLSHQVLSLAKQKGTPGA